MYMTDAPLTANDLRTADEEMYYIGKTLRTAEYYPSDSEELENLNPMDLSCEVMWSAMNYLKSNPEATIADACEFGLNEWLK